MGWREGDLDTAWAQKATGEGTRRNFRSELPALQLSSKVPCLSANPCGAPGERSAASLPDSELDHALRFLVDRPQPVPDRNFQTLHSAKNDSLATGRVRPGQ
jgi:hypothetical protein